MAPQDEPKGRPATAGADYLPRGPVNTYPPIKSVEQVNEANTPKNRDKVSSGRGAI